MTDLVHPDRRKKLEELRAAGHDPFPARGVENLPIGEVLAGMGTSTAPGPRNGTEVQLAGRLASLRDFGKLMFAPLLDRSGKLQIGFQKDKLGAWWEQRKHLDAGDLVGVRGLLGFTQKGEPTLWATEVKLLAKALAPPPEKWHGLADVEQRYRRRYVDLWASEGVKDVFILRSRMISLLRHFLEKRGFLEVETPTLHPIAGGATARPFKTHHNALGVDLYLRIAPELYLKRLVVGGLERVFEVSRNFRNEGISTRHNPEFTMMELYQAQADFRHMMELTESLIEHLALELRGTSAIEFRGAQYSLAKPFRRVRYDELFRDANGGLELADHEGVARRARELGIKLAPRPGASAESLHWALATEVFDHTVEPLLTGPVFVTHFPTPLSPLAKCDPADARYTERFELYLGGMELANAFSELNDPDEQQRRFEEQIASKDPEAPGEVDVDYVQALEYGMPPTGGLGIGLDRLAMVLANQDSIRDVLLFPTLRPIKAEGAMEMKPVQIEGQGTTTPAKK